MLLTQFYKIPRDGVSSIPTSEAYTQSGSGIPVIYVAAQIPPKWDFLSPLWLACKLQGDQGCAFLMLLPARSKPGPGPDESAWWSWALLCPAGIAVCIGMASTFAYANSTLREQVSLKVSHPANWSPMATVTNDHKLSGLKHQCFIL